MLVVCLFSVFVNFVQHLINDRITTTSSSTTTTTTSSNEDVDDSDIEKGNVQNKISLPEFDSGLSETELCLTHE